MYLWRASRARSCCDGYPEGRFTGAFTQLLRLLQANSRLVVRGVRLAKFAGMLRRVGEEGVQVAGGMEGRWMAGEEESFDGLAIIEAASRRIPTVFDYLRELRREEVPRLPFRVQ